MVELVTMTMPKAPIMKCSMGRVRLNAGGYDNRGSYWGEGQPLYWMCSDCGESWQSAAHNVLRSI